MIQDTLLKGDGYLAVALEATGVLIPAALLYKVTKQYGPQFEVRFVLPPFN